MRLSIGPRPGEDLDELRACFIEHRRRFSDGDYAVQVFEQGLPDYRDQENEDVPAGVGCPGLPD